MSTSSHVPMVDMRARVEPDANRRTLGAINDCSADGPDGWLVLACEGQTVLEMRMLPSEIACETAARFGAAMAAACPSRTPARRTPRAVLLDYLMLTARRERLVAEHQRNTRETGSLWRSGAAVEATKADLHDDDEF